MSATKKNKPHAGGNRERGKKSSTAHTDTIDSVDIDSGILERLDALLAGLEVRQ